MAIRHRTRRSPTALEIPPDLRLLKRRYALEGQIVENKLVFRAWDAQRGYQVVVKQAQGKLHMGRLLQEAMLLERLDHPSLPTLLDYFEQEEEQCAYLVEAWMPGLPLHEHPWLGLGEVVWVGQRLCAILRYLHTCGIIHRDLKPGNILLEPGVSLSLIDFSIAAWESDPWCKAGTPGYVAPEQWATGQIHQEADWYSLGMVLGCLLTHCHPDEIKLVGSFSGLWDDPRSIPQESRRLLNLFDRLIAQDPGTRPSLSDLQHALERVHVG